MHVFPEIHERLPREAPGSPASTLKALAMAGELPRAPRILDVGCGPGAQTLDLAKATRGHVVAVDIHQPFLDRLSRSAESQGLGGRIEVRNESMFTMDFPDASFDLLWSEGSLYVIGFEEGLQGWRRFLKEDARIGVSELCWTRPSPPEEAREFWEERYPGIRPVDEALTIVRRLDYVLLGHFALPESDWWDGYYGPLEKRILELRERHAHDRDALDELDGEEREIRMVRKYPGVVGYEFYVLRN